MRTLLVKNVHFYLPYVTEVLVAQPAPPPLFNPPNASASKYHLKKLEIQLPKGESHHRQYAIGRADEYFSG